MQNLLQVKNLSIYFPSKTGKIPAVNNISFQIKEGETLGVVGESGSGKTVTALSIVKLLKEYDNHSSSGEIFYTKEGTSHNLLALKENQIRCFRGKEIGMIFQEPMSSLNPLHKCGDQVLEAILIHQNVSKSIAKHKVMDLFEEVKLGRNNQIYQAYPHELSGGQKQRIMIAMAIANNPKLLIADEPTTALDATVQKGILDLLKKIQKSRKMSVLFITHDLGIVENLCHRVMVMYKGKIVEEGLTSRIFSSPKHPYTKGLLLCKPPLNQRLSWLPTIADFIDINQDGSVVESKKSVEEIKKAFLISPKERQTALDKLYQQAPLLEVKNLTTCYPIKSGLFRRTTGYHYAVNEVSFEVYPGETLGLVGESGCGKSTLGRSILNLIEPQKGSVLFKGQDLLKMPEEKLRKLRRDIQIIFQDSYSSLNPKMSVGRSIMEPMLVHNIYTSGKERRLKAMELLEMVSLKEEHFDRLPHEFSGGQRQRICIARALALKPEFIICDESVSSLDVSVQATILNLLNKLKNLYGFTCIFISHDVSVVKFMSDRIMVMNNGKMEEIGDADALYHHPKSAYTQKLLNAVPGYWGG